MVIKNFTYSALLFISITSSTLLGAADGAPWRNYGYEPHRTCYNTSSTNCYPIHYENADGSSNIFANYVAYLNVFSGVFNLVTYSIGNRLVTKWDREITENIQRELTALADAEGKLRHTLALIIQGFNNGIGAPGDLTMASGVVEKLNKSLCDTCINDFVDIVSQHFDDNDSHEARANRIRFLRFVVLHESEEADLGHICQKLAASDSFRGTEYDSDTKSWLGHAWAAFARKWSHPAHWSSFAYVLGTFAATIPITAVVDVHNRAGSFVGDMANAANAIVIPTAYAYATFQQWMNLDRAKAKRLIKEIEERFENIRGVIEIAGRTIGTMENGISLAEARGFLKALMLARWNEGLVKEFIHVSVTGSTPEKRELITSLRAELRALKIPYRDRDIDAALAKPSDVDIPLVNVVTVRDDHDESDSSDVETGTASAQ